MLVFGLLVASGQVRDVGYEEMRRKRIRINPAENFLGGLLDGLDLPVERENELGFIVLKKEVVAAMQIAGKSNRAKIFNNKIDREEINIPSNVCI